MNQKQCVEAIELAMTTLREVCEDETTMAKDKVSATKVLLDAVCQSEESQRRDMLAAHALPLLMTTVNSLRGEINEEDAFAPIYDLEPQDQANFVLALAQEIK